MTTPAAIHAADERLQTILKAHVVGATVQDPASRPAGERQGYADPEQVARRLAGCVRAADTVSRQGGDEFMALLHDMVGMNEALAVAEKIRRAVGAPILLEGREARVSVSIGIALYPDHGTDLDSLSRHADAAMYRDKSNRRNGASAAVIRRTGQ
mgnify:CR=1 FL=1